VSPKADRWAGGGGAYSGFHVSGMIEWGQKSTPKKSHANFPSLKYFHKGLNDITRKIKTLEIV